MLFFILFATAFSQVYYSVVYRNGEYAVVPGKFQDACSYGYYKNEIDKDGWGKLFIRSNYKLEEKEQGYCNGFLEGYLTQHEMYLYWTNYKANEYNNSQPSQKLLDVMQEQLDFFKMQSGAAADDYWKRQQVIKYQFNGLVDGYVSASPANEALSELELYMLNSVGDLENLNDLYKTGDEPVTSRVYLQAKYPDRIFHECSALVKAVGDEVYFSHNTWRGYYAMLRIYKVYNVYYGNRKIKLSFSSSPGLIHSKDDYYTVSADDTQLFVMETTNSVKNESVYEPVNDKLLSWQRILLGLYWMTNAKEFAEVIKPYNSGTYDNQWIIFDLNAWKKDKKEALFICEQMPGLMISEDVTRFLTSEDKQNMWPSYNVPYNRTIYEKSGYNMTVNEYEECSRAKIFKRDSKNVVDLESMKYIMSYNDYKNDEFSNGDPKESIASRYDLREETPNPFGAIDVKIVQSSKPHITHAICGPTHQNQPPFEWTDTFANSVHVGVPQKFDFEWVEIEDTF